MLTFPKLTYGTTDQAVLRQLLIDHTASAKARKEKEDPNIRVNIFWATSDYEQQWRRLMAITTR